MKTKLFFTKNFEKAHNEITKAGGHVTQKFTDEIFVVNLPESFEIESLKESSGKPLSELDELSTLMIEAWEAVEQKQAKSTEAAKDVAVSWDTEGFQHPKNLYNDEQLKTEFEEIKNKIESTGIATSEYMTGKIALGLLIVSGTPSGLGISNAENKLVVQEVMEGCQFLATAGGVRANIHFVYVIHPLTINSQPNPTCSSYENCQSIVRDPALTQLGYPTGYVGCVQFVNDLKSNHKTDWAYMAFITKYPLSHFAYAYGVNLYMEYSNDGWGPGKINQLFAHETCHIFGAADEYNSGKLKCSCSPSGANKVKNQNCVNCATPYLPHVGCLMDGNLLSLCTWSRGQIGWEYFEETNQPIDNFAGWAAAPGVQIITGDFNGNGLTDMAAVGGKGWATQPLAFSNGDGTFNVTNQLITDFAAWAAQAGVRVIAGDFNGNGLTDMALVGGAGWTTQPVAFSNGDGTFKVTNQPITNFATWTTTPGVQVIAGDFNGNGLTDMAVVGGKGWATQPVAFSNGDGTFNVTNQPITDFAAWGAQAGVRVIAGDFNGNGLTDMALVGGAGWTTQPVAFSNGDGTFNVTNQPITDFAAWGAQAGVRVIAGDFNGNGLTDMALVCGAGWTTQPVAFSNGDGTFNVTNQPIANFAAWATTPGVQIISGDFTGNGFTDMALVGGKGWATVPVAFSSGNGLFNVSNITVQNFAVWASTNGVHALGGNFKAKGQMSIALTGAAGWASLPIAYYDKGSF